MKIPEVEITEFTYRLKEDLGYISKVINSDQIKKFHCYLHKNNTFNRRYSVVFSSFNDLRVVSERLSQNIDESVVIERKIQEGGKIDQSLQEHCNSLSEQNQVDLKSLYLYSKIFCDDFVTLLIFMFDWRTIANRSITTLYTSLKKYEGDNGQVLRFIESCLGDIKQIGKFITDYRDDNVVHNQRKHKETVWFINEMDGRVRFDGGNRSSVTPQEVVFLISYFVQNSRDFILSEFGFVLE